MQFLFVGPNVCRQLLSDSPSRRTPLLLANTPYCKAYSGLSPYSEYPCLTHKITAAMRLRSFLLKHTLFLFFKVQRIPIHTIPQMCWGRAIIEYVAQVAAAAGA